MSRAIKLSKGGWPAPNPHVGCVIVRDGEVVGEGFHSYAGGPHAEAVALTQASGKTEGGTAYVTLEPCNHHGRTPPCSEALVRAGIKRVVVACLDPNPVASGGIERLRSVGIEVEQGLLTDEAAQANAQFLTSIALRRPRVVIKAAMSLDGRIALPSGESKWITGPSARKEAHRLRLECGAVLVGRKTVEVDDPQLNARLKNVVNQPTRIVLDPQNKLDSRYRVFDSSAPTLHVSKSFIGQEAFSGKLDLTRLMNALYSQGIRGVMVEGGASTITHFLEAGLVDRIELFVGSKILGAGPSWVGDLKVDKLADAPTFRLVSVKKLSGDVRISLSR